MNTNSNSYTIIYASIAHGSFYGAAFLLAFVSSSLKEKQYQMLNRTQRNKFWQL